MALWSAKPTRAASPRTVAPAVISNIFLRVMLISICELTSPEFSFSRLVDVHHPGRLQQRERDQANDCRRGNQKWVADFPAEQNRERNHPDQDREPVSDRDAA